MSEVGKVLLKLFVKLLCLTAARVFQSIMSSPKTNLLEKTKELAAKRMEAAET